MDTSFCLTGRKLIPATVTKGGFTTPVWQQALWKKGAFARKIRHNGCGHCCTAMAATLMGKKIDPYEEYMLCRTLWGAPDETREQDHFLSVGGIAQVLNHLGVKTQCFGAENKEQSSHHIVEQLQEGRLVILMADPFGEKNACFSTGYHYVLLADLTDDGKILVANSSQKGATQNGIQFVTREDVAQTLLAGSTADPTRTWGSLAGFEAGCGYVVVG